MPQKLPPRSGDFSEWYNQLVLMAGLADYGPARGTMVIRPYGYALWELAQGILNTRIKAMGAENAYFPLFIPERFIKAEKAHISGFAPEIAWVTHGGGKKLEEKLAVRPTSETIIYHMFAQWLSSWRELPIKLNQWTNVVRWELRTRLFIRTLEFLWQEGHTAHATEKECNEQAEEALAMYRHFAHDVLLIPAIAGRKSESEKFAGGAYTLALEALMGDGRALQLATSHNLGQNFAKIFNIRFKDSVGAERLVWQTSWGMTTRIIGALIMVHGDERGLVLPPLLAPFQTVIVPIYKTNEERLKIVSYIHKKILPALQNYRVHFDERDHYSPGWKFNEWELKGVPLRIEIGPKEIKSGRATFVRRDMFKRTSGIVSARAVEKYLNTIAHDMFGRAEAFLKKNTHTPATWEEFKERLSTSRGFMKVFWCNDAACEQKFKEETGATIRVILKETTKEKGQCIKCKTSSTTQVIFAKAY